MDEFEEMFKTKAQGPSVDITMTKQKAPQKGPSKVSLLEANRAKNLAITLRKAGKSPEEICKAIQSCVYTFALLHGVLTKVEIFQGCKMIARSFYVEQE